jgi:hypothetical protein
MTGEDQNDPTEIAGFTDAAEPKPRSALIAGCAHPDSSKDKQARKLAEAEVLMLANLAKSGIIDGPTIDLCFEAKTQTYTRKITGYLNHPSYREKYYHLGKLDEPLDVVRLRMLGPDVKQRLWMPKGADLRLFVPPLKIIADELAKTHPHFTVVEAAKKAVLACLKGILTVALSGVDTFSQTKQGKFLIDDIQELIDLGAEFTVCFDGNIADNPNVQKAHARFLGELLNAGCKPTYKILPDGLDFDDWLIDKTKTDFDGIEAEPYSAVKPLFDLNDYGAVVTRPPVILIKHDNALLNKEQFFLTEPYRARIVDPETLKRKPAAKYWADSWPQVARYASLDYAPGEPADLPGGVRNMYRDTGVGAVEGDVTLLLRVLDQLFPDPAMRKWGVARIAYAFQHPNEKLQTALVLWGDPGTGKSSLFHNIFQAVLGPTNVVKITAAQLSSQFNGSWLPDRQFIVCEEINGIDPRHDSARIKDYISAIDQQVNQKNLPERTVRSIATWVFLSNDKCPVFMARDDRRFGVSHVKKILTENEIVELRKWGEGVGAPAVRYYFENYDLSEFDPYADPPLSADKLKVIRASQSTLEGWATELMESDDRPNYCSFSKLISSANLYEGKDHAVKAVTNALEKAGAVDLGRWRLIPGIDKSKISGWSLRFDAANTQNDATTYLSDPANVKKIEEFFKYFLKNDDRLKC